MTRYYHSSRLQCRKGSANNNPFNTLRLTFFALTVFFISSCEEGPTKIGNGLLPASDFAVIESTDTLSVWSYTMYDKSVVSSNPAVSYLGQIKDPFFGTTTAEFVTQIRLASEWDDRPFTIDSVKMILEFFGAKGSTGVKHKIRISEIASQIYTDSTYYSDRKVDTTGFGVTFELPALRADTINFVAMDITAAFGNYITRDTSKFFYSNSKPDFRSYFKGLYFRILPSPDPLLVSLNLAPSATATSYANYIIMYMHNEVNIAKQFFFILDAINTNAAFNRFSHDFSTATMGNKMVNKNDTSYGHRDSLSYLQYLNGVYTKLRIPGLEKIKKDASYKRIGINKARLTVPVYFDGNIYKPSTVPPQLVLRYKTNTGTKYYVPDYYVDTYHSFYGGIIDSTNKVYTFNIPAFVQGYLLDVTEDVLPELEIFQGSGTNNVILKTSKSKTPVKFDFTFTKY